jgi:hypothetical protein
MEIGSCLTSVVENIQAYLVVICNFQTQFLTKKNIAIDNVLDCTHNINIKATLLEYEVFFRLYLGYE